MQKKAQGVGIVWLCVRQAFQIGPALTWAVASQAAMRVAAPTAIVIMIDLDSLVYRFNDCEDRYTPQTLGDIAEFAAGERDIEVRSIEQHWWNLNNSLRGVGQHETTNQLHPEQI